MKPEIKNIFKSFALEVVIYGILVVAYFFLVLHFFSEVLFNLFQTDRAFYAVVALSLIIGQGIVLEILTRALLGYLRKRWEK